MNRLKQVSSPTGCRRVADSSSTMCHSGRAGVCEDEMKYDDQILLKEFTEHFLSRLKPQ